MSTDEKIAERRAAGTFAALRERIRLLSAAGLWPYTPDPAEPGLQSFGAALPDAPLILVGNSRHSLKRLERALRPFGGRLLVLDTGGLGLQAGWYSGLLHRDQIVTAAREQRSRALLPFSVWEALGGDSLTTEGLLAGPAMPEDLLPFLLGDIELTEEVKTGRAPFPERLHESLAHGLPLALGCALLLPIFDSLMVIMTSMALIGLVAVTLAATMPYVPGRLVRFRRGVAILVGMMLGIGIGVVMRPAIVGILAAGVAGAMAAFWLGRLCRTF